MTHEDFIFVSVNQLYNVVQKQDTTITKKYVANWLNSHAKKNSNLSTIHDFYTQQINLTFSNKYKNLNDCIMVKKETSTIGISTFQGNSPLPRQNFGCTKMNAIRKSASGHVQIILFVKVPLKM